MSVMSITIDQGIFAPGYSKEVVDELNAVDKSYVYQLMSTVQLDGSKIFYSWMHMHTGNQKQ